uniref:Uncharacterized protein n=1 Tax=Leersia perrieri TaxID=77586 RepID=A0A0D9WTE1_9ORYZ
MEQSSSLLGQSELLRYRAIRLRRAEWSRLREAANAERDRDARLAMVLILTLLLALATPAVLIWCALRRGGDADALLVTIMWRLSLLLSAYFFLCAIVLSVTRGVCAAVLDFSYGLLLAYFADHVLGPRIGMVVVYVSSLFAAGMAGYALAERRRSDGDDRSADNVPAFATEEEEEYARSLLISSALILSLVLLAPAAYFTYTFVWPYASGAAAGRSVESMMRDISFAMLTYLFFSTTFVTHHLLRGALLGEGNFYIFLITFAIILFLPLPVSSVFGDIAGIIVLWLGVISLAVFFGYSLGVYSSYKQRVDHELSYLGHVQRAELERGSGPPARTRADVAAGTMALQSPSGLLQAPVVSAEPPPKTSQ